VRAIASERGEPFVRARGLVKRYRKLTAVAGVDFEIFPGETYGLLGPNGAGKTTIVRMLTCFSPVTSGTAEVAGRDVARFPRETKALTGVVPQEDNLDPDLSVRRNLLVYARYYGISRGTAAARADELLEFIGLTEKRNEPIRRISGGMKRRLILARALVSEPRLLVLDEPTTGLDPQARHAVWERIRSFRRRGVTVLLTTHYMDEAHHLCDRVAIIDGGKILVEGSPDELVAEHAPGNVIEVWDFPAELAAWAAEKEIASEMVGDRLLLRPGEVGQAFLPADSAQTRMSAPPPEELYREILDRWRAARVHFRRGSLEDVFLKLTGRELRE